MANPSVHYLGVVGTAARDDHAQCPAQWERIKAERRTEYGPDGAYNFGACVHGEGYIGRGWGRDSAANGVESGVNHNPGSRAICVMVGTDDEIPDACKRRVAAFAHEAVNEHGMSWPLRPHSSYVATACPGDKLRDVIDEINAGRWSEEDEMTNEELAGLLGAWEKDTREQVTKAINDAQAQWEWDTRKEIKAHIDKRFDEIVALVKK